MQRAVEPHVGRLLGGGHEIGFETELATQLETPRHAGEKGVGGSIDRAPGELGADDLAAEVIARLVHDDLGVGRLGAQLVRRGQSGDAAAYDGEACHSDNDRTRSASAPSTASSS